MADPYWQKQGFSSRRQYENNRVSKLGFKNYSQYQKLASNPTYIAGIKRVAELSGKSERELRAADSAYNKEVVSVGVREAVRDIDDKVRDLPGYDGYQYLDGDFDSIDEMVDDMMEAGIESTEIRGALTRAGLWT